MNGGEELEPQAPVQVTISYDGGEQIEDNTQVTAVHLPEDGETELIETESDTAKDVLNDVSFTADSFSIYGVVYTVEFHWDVDGKMYDFSIPGGGFVSFSQLVEVLGLAKQDANQDPDGEANVIKASSDTEQAPLALENVTLSEDTRKFVADVESITFSSPSLLSVSKVNENTTVGAIKDGLGLDCEYSAELTEEQIAEIDGQTVDAGDWALISLKAFDMEESLNVTMKNGDRFEIRVTDAQDPSIFIGKKVVIHYDGCVMTSDWASEYNRTDFHSVPESTADLNPNAVWTIEYDVSTQGYYLKSNTGKYLYLDHSTVQLVDSRNSVTALTIQPGENPDYRIYDKNDSNRALVYCDNKEYEGFFCAWEGANNQTPNTSPRDWLYIREVIQQTPSTPHKNWLLYLDEDSSEITIGVGDTLTLRPYGEWYWKNDDQPDELKSKRWTCDDGNWDISLPLEMRERGSYFDPNELIPFVDSGWVRYGEGVLTDYTAGFWRAEQFLKNKDGKAVVFISDGIPTLHIPNLNGTLEGADTATGSKYYPDSNGGCPDDAKLEFGYFVNDVTEKYGYKFGKDIEFYTGWLQ